MIRLFLISHVECRLLFTGSRIGKSYISGAINILRSSKARRDLLNLKEIILLEADNNYKFRTYNDVIKDGNHTPIDIVLARIRCASDDDVCNLQYTSGTTGSPKAAMLTHKYFLELWIVVFCTD